MPPPLYWGAPETVHGPASCLQRQVGTPHVRAAGQKDKGSWVPAARGEADRVSGPVLFSQERNKWPSELISDRELGTRTYIEGKI